MRPPGRPAHAPAQRLERAWRSSCSIVRARCNAAAVWVTSKGCTGTAVLADEVVGAGLAREADDGLSLAQDRALHRHEVEPVADRVDEDHVGTLQRGDRAREVVTAVEHDRVPVVARPTVVHLIGDRLDLGPVVPVLGERLAGRIEVGDEGDAAAQVPVLGEELVEREEPAPDVLGGFDAVDADDALAIDRRVRRGTSPLCVPPRPTAVAARSSASGPNVAANALVGRTPSNDSLLAT